jgi:hypothetical protein
MRRVLRNAPRRLSLLNSPGLVLNNKPEIVQNLSLFPNPSSDKVYIKGLNQSSNTSISLVNIFGKKWFPELEQSDNNCLFSVAQMPAGLYVVTVEKESKIFTFRLIVK